MIANNSLFFFTREEANSNNVWKRDTTGITLENLVQHQDNVYDEFLDSHQLSPDNVLILYGKSR